MHFDKCSLFNHAGATKIRALERICSSCDCCQIESDVLVLCHAGKKMHVTVGVTDASMG